MIHHVSIPAREPRHLLEVLAELIGGRCRPFGPLEGAFVATNGDEHGTMIEVYPERAPLDTPASAARSPKLRVTRPAVLSSGAGE